jgi:hypothetical protein
VSDLLKLLAESGITGAQLVAFVITIIVAFFSARWGGAESRRQFSIKQVSEKRTAALNLIPLLLQFAATCERKRSNLDLFISSGGQAGEDEQTQGLEIDPLIRIYAGQLSTEVAERAIDRSGRRLWTACSLLPLSDGAGVEKREQARRTPNASRH